MNPQRIKKLIEKRGIQIQIFQGDVGEVLAIQLLSFAKILHTSKFFQQKERVFEPPEPSTVNHQYIHLYIVHCTLYVTTHYEQQRHLYCRFCPNMISEIYQSTTEKQKKKKIKLKFIHVNTFCPNLHLINKISNERGVQPTCPPLGPRKDSLKTIFFLFT